MYKVLRTLTFSRKAICNQEKRKKDMLSSYLGIEQYIIRVQKCRVGKTGSLGRWRKVIGYCRSVRILSVIPLAGYK